MDRRGAEPGQVIEPPDTDRGLSNLDVVEPHGLDLTRKTGSTDDWHIYQVTTSRHHPKVERLEFQLLHGTWSHNTGYKK